ncbi:MAG: hypothetical protein LC739_06495 [Actinobacteria bacterium]|nr:hypothetical protein [Actinomycetota bacterium]
MWLHSTILALLAAASVACDGSNLTTGEGGNSTPPSDLGLPASDDDRIPLTELGSGVYLGFKGGLYPSGSNEIPDDHAAAGRAALSRIEPLDPGGRADPRGRVVLVSVGMSNTTQEFCSQKATPPCDPWTFMGQAAVDPKVNRTTLVIVNGARGGQAAETWDSPSDPNYDRVRDHRLVPNGLSEKQVQIAWVKEANPRPTISLPNPGADAFQLERSLGRIVRAMKTRWPNLRIVFFSSRIYGGYATTDLNPEPYAYESGFSVKWVIEAQVEQARTGRIDRESGDLALARTPWLAWGPYLWADGTNPRVDGLAWQQADLERSDGTHPSRSGEEKVARLLLDFFKTSPAARCWFLAGRSCN